MLAKRENTTALRSVKQQSSDAMRKSFQQSNWRRWKIWRDGRKNALQG